MKVAVFSTRRHDRPSVLAANQAAGLPHTFAFLDARLEASTAQLADGSNAVCVFVNDCVDRATLALLYRQGVRLVALRCAGFNNVDLNAAGELGIKIARVPVYSPWAVAEHAAALILSLDRKIHRAYARVREGNFALDGLLGFDLHGRTIGLVGAGRIGTTMARIMAGFGCAVIVYDPVFNAEIEALGGRHVAFEQLLPLADIISLHCPLTPETRHLIGATAIERMKPGVMLINTSRGAVVDTRAVIDGLKSGKIGYLGLDVYEEEGDLFFEDFSNQVIQDDVFARLLTFPNVLITGHQGFFTAEAISSIAETTIANLTAFEEVGIPVHEVTAEKHFCTRSDT